MRNNWAGALAIVLAACGGPSGEREQQPSDLRQFAPEQAVTAAPAARTDSTQVPRPTVVVGCVHDRARVSFAEIRWLKGPGMVPDSTVLDVTVFKDGFDSGRFAALGATPQPRVLAFFQPGPALRALSLANPSRRQVGDTTVVRVERLDPGINYIWRVRTISAGKQVAGSPIRVQVAACVSDERP